ncbi:MAG: polyphosphate polymerase domain-containing protein [Deltaproteobacteria bacterium]|nr:polyphosphate polymerase domain-containing protein [Deltaproteobacteria bacterium]
MSTSATVLTDTLHGFEQADANRIGERALLRRYDSKFLLPQDAFCPWLKSLQPHYTILLAAQSPIANYRTVYFDTPERTSYHDHARGRRPRTKIRIRHYAERHLSFLEIKTKTNHGQTVKARQKRAFNDETLAVADHAFVAGLIRIDPLSLSPSLVTDFRRITLLARERDERVTVDLDMSFEQRGDRQFFPPVALVEIKQGRFTRTTPAMAGLHAFHGRSVAFSKYCMSLALSGEVPRTHTFRPALRLLERMSHA